MCIVMDMRLHNHIARTRSRARTHPRIEVVGTMPCIYTAFTTPLLWQRQVVVVEVEEGVGRDDAHLRSNR